MMFIALLVPFGLLAVLLGMERLERWTVRERDTEFGTASATGATDVPFSGSAAAPQ